MPLHGMRVLIAEDDFFIGVEIEDAVLSAGGKPLGPVARVADAMNVIERESPEAAILDVSLLDGQVDPVVDLLCRSGVPLVLQTGEAPDDMRHRFPNLPLLAKPVPAPEIVALLRSRVGR